MNRIYKLVKNWRTGQSIAVSELAKGNKKSVSGKLLALSVGLIISSGAVAGENLTYTGSEPLDNITINGTTYTYFGSSTSTSGNNITVDFTTGTNLDYVFGGVGAGIINNNTVIINDGVINAAVNGGFAEGINKVSANNNKVIMNNGTISHSSNSISLIGGYAVGSDTSDNITASNNSVSIVEGTLGSVTNAVIIKGGHVTLTKDGADHVSMSANNNQINFDNTSGSIFVNANHQLQLVGGTVQIDGSYVVNTTTPFSSADISAKGNSVVVNGLEPSTLNVYNYQIFGGLFASNDASPILATLVNSVAIENNKVVIKNSVMNQNSTAMSEIYGGRSNAAINVSISNNSVLIEDSEINERIRITGAVNWATHGSEAKLDNNTVTLERVKIDATTGYSQVGGGYLSVTNNGTVVDTAKLTGNTVNINDVSITNTGTDFNQIFGGRIDIANTKLIDDAQITNNTINITTGGDDLDLTKVDLYGGLIVKSGSGSFNTADFISGNTLNIHSSYDSVGNPTLAVNSAQNFENYNFYLGADITDGDVLLSSTNAIDLDYLSPADGTTVKDVNVAVKEIAMGSGLKTGDTVVLMDNVAVPNSSTTYQNGVVSQGQAQQGLGSLYDITVKLNGGGNQLEATIGEGQATEQSKALFEGNLAGLAFVNQGADLVNGQGIQNALQATDGEVDSVGFGAMGGGKSRYQTGSHVDVRGISLMTGYAKSMDKFTLGGFIEAGWGNYDSYNSFNSHNVDGDGSTNYYGVGALAHYQLNEQAYLDGSLRIGRVDTDFDSNDFLSGSGSTLSADYKTKSTYLGAQLGGGYVVSLSERQTIDFSANYLWTYQGSDDVTLKTGDKVSFDSANSHRLRVGSRYFYESGKAIQPYLGAAYEYEFSGKGKGSINGFSVQDNPELKGGTGIFELGTQSGAIAGTGFSIDMNIKGYVGTREGVSGQLNVRYGF